MDGLHSRTRLTQVMTWKRLPTHAGVWPTDRFGANEARSSGRFAPRSRWLRPCPAAPLSPPSLIDDWTSGPQNRSTVVDVHWLCPPRNGCVNVVLSLREKLRKIRIRGSKSFVQNELRRKLPCAVDDNEPSPAVPGWPDEMLTTRMHREADEAVQPEWSHHKRWLHHKGRCGAGFQPAPLDHPPA